MTDDSPNRKLKTLTAFRAMFVTVLLGSFFIFEIGYGRFPYPASILHLIIALYALTIIYAVLIGRMSSLPLAYLQLFLDVVAASALIFITGGIESWFSPLLLIIVIASAMVAGERAGYTIATCSSILYGSLIDLQFYRILPIPYDPLIMERDFLYNIFSLITALYLTAYLTGHFAARLERKDIDIRELALFNREVIEHTPSGLFTADLSGRALIFNRAAESITGIDRNDVVGTDIIKVFPFLNSIRQIDLIEGAITASGMEKVIGLSISEMLDAEGRESGYIGVFQDLTELRTMAEEIKKKEKLAVIGELAASIAHEIRNPLASLKGSIELLSEGAATSGQREKLMSIALNEMDRLNAIITDFLNYSRPGLSEARLFDLHKVLGETLDLLVRDCEKVSLKKDFSGTLFITADPRRLRQVFWNLGLNSIEAMPEGGLLTVETSARDGGIRITFADTGKGIGSGDMKKLFYPFFTTKEKGTGLGLSIAYRIIEDHGGSISVQSRPGLGAEFNVILPRHRNGN